MERKCQPHPTNRASFALLSFASVLSSSGRVNFQPSPTTLYIVYRFSSAREPGAKNPALRAFGGDSHPARGRRPQVVRDLARVPPTKNRPRTPWPAISAGLESLHNPPYPLGRCSRYNLLATQESSPLARVSGALVSLINFPHLRRAAVSMHTSIVTISSPNKGRLNSTPPRP